MQRMLSRSIDASCSRYETHDGGGESRYMYVCASEQDGPILAEVSTGVVG